jgi:lambda repressor-like predicted transcriptional regulator
MRMQPHEIKAALMLARVRQAAIARACGFSQSYVSEVIRGNRRSPKIERAVAKAIGKEPVEIFGPMPEPEAAFVAA